MVGWWVCFTVGGEVGYVVRFYFVLGPVFGGGVCEFTRMYRVSVGLVWCLLGYGAGFDFGRIL